MIRTTALLFLSILTMAVVLLNGVGAPAQPTGGAASRPAATQPAFPLWDGKEPVAAYAKRAGIKDVQITLALDGNVTLKLTLIPAGQFMMGSPAREKDRHSDEGPQRQVTISKPFYMGVYTVTQEQYEQVVGKKRWGFKGARNPVETASWWDAGAFCEKLSEKTGMTVSLPTEVQWEYACRAGSTTRFGYGDDGNYGKLGEYAWYFRNSGGKTHPVGLKKPNDWGLYDMHGNVWEWCTDAYAGSYADTGKIESAGPASGLEYVLRGGSWRDDPGDCRSADRDWDSPYEESCDVGFRVSVDLRSAGGPATRPARPAASRRAATQPAYPLWDGKGPVADYAKRAGIKDAQIALSLDSNVTMKLTLIPAGQFLMGSPDSQKDRPIDEGPQREVTISRPFYMGVCPVTQEQYEQAMGANPSYFKGAQDPVQNVSWDGAVEFCKTLSKKTGKTVRLPTEAEWEYACRAGSQTRFCFGDNDDKLGDYAWYNKNSDSKTHPVGQKKANDWGLYDMHGNVWQWCADWYDRDSYVILGETDPAGPASGRDRVLRGGCWGSDPRECCSPNRFRLAPVRGRIIAGFRVSMDLK